MSALGGLTVVDLSTGRAAALASMFLADNGARVVRLVSEDWQVLRQPDIFALYDRGKEVARLDPTWDADAFADWVAVADVVLDDDAPASALRSRLGLDSLTARHAHLVHCSITAYGPRGPLRDEPADHDLVAARMGILASQPSYRRGPIHVAHPVAYIGAGLLATMGVSAALFQRERTGRGRRVETSLMAGALLYTPKAVGPNVPVRPMNMTPQGGGPFYSIFECADGEWLQIGCIHSGFVDLAATVIGVADVIASTPEFGDGRWPRSEEARRRLFDIVAEAIRKRPSWEWVRLLQAADVPCDLSQAVEDAIGNPQIVHNGMVLALDDPLLGWVEMAGLPIGLSATPGRVRGPRAGGISLGTPSRPRGQAPRPSAIEGDGGRLVGAGSSGTRSPQPSPIEGDGGRWRGMGSFGTLSRSGGQAPQPSPIETQGERSVEAGTDVSLPLAGVRIMEMTNVIAGPVAGRLLADLGADMIKFESLDGDISRPAGGAGFIAFNANKRSVSANTRTDQGKRIARSLAASADAILANMRPGAMDRMGLDADTLGELNPSMVQTHVTAYGWDGPYAQRPGVDPIAQAITGLQHAQGGYNGPPVYLSALAPCDYTGGALGALGTILGLLAKARFGVGQKVNTNLLSAGVVMGVDGFLKHAGKEPRKLPDRDQIGTGPLRRLYQVSDGWVYVAADQMDQGDGPVEQAAVELAEDLRELTVSGALELLRSRGMPSAPVVDRYAQLFDADPQAAANDMVAELQHPTFGVVTLSGNLVSFDGGNTLPVRSTPLLGEHTREVLSELGYAPEVISDLHSEGIVKTELPV